ncbi:hypothetical protein K438DRAFT_1640059, partial [Mycena galopus ATCC 62051]
SALNYLTAERDRDAVIEWYSPLIFSLRQEDIFSAYQPGTGEWFLRNEIFEEWKSGRGRVLWCHGMPGAGKTVLCSLVVHHLQTIHAPDVGVAAIYLNHKESEAHSPSMLLAALWRQLVAGKSISRVQELYRVHREPGSRPSLEDGLNVLRSVISECSKVFIIVDALDEYHDHDRDLLLRQLSLLQPSLRGTSVNLMLTSRSYIMIGHCIPNFTALEIRATAEDIRAYLTGRIRTSPRISKHIRNSPGLRDAIEERVVESNDGMFLLAKLRIDSLERPTLRTVREALASIPRDLERSYDEVVERINRQNEEDRKLAWRTLSFITHAERPLRSSKLLEALATKPGDTTFDSDDLMDEDTVLSVCAGLLVINHEDHTFRLVHYTVHDYLQRIIATQYPTSDAIVVRHVVDGDETEKTARSGPAAGAG